MDCLDCNGVKLVPGDVVTVTVKYAVVKVYDDGHVLAQKVYDVPASVLTKVIGEKIFKAGTFQGGETV
jgi:hypothetical protein